MDITTASKNDKMLLMRAVSFGRLQKVEKLLKADKDINFRDKDGVPSLVIRIFPCSY